MKHTTNGELLTELILEIFSLSGSLVNEGDELVKELGGLTSARWKVLGALAISGVPMSVAQIAKSMGGQTRQGVQRLADIMEKDGLLKYRENPNHKTAKLAELAERGGEELYRRAESVQIPWANSLAENLSTDDLRITLQVARDLSAGLTKKR